MRRVVLSSFLVLAVFGCSATSSGNHFTGTATEGAGADGTGASGQGGGPSTSSGLGASFTTGTASGGTGGGTPGCSTAAELVYVLSTDNTLWSFDPGAQQFTMIGPLGCNVPDGAQPNSMAVDRNATAWVNYVASTTDPITLMSTDTSGYVYQVSTKDATCAATPAVTLPSSAWYRLGMGFSADMVSGTAETLFVTGTGSEVGMADSPGLGTIDLTAGSLNPIGQFTGDATLIGQSAELTGTGDARLFGFFTTDPVRVAQLDKTAAGVLTDWPVANVPVPNAWAFSFWGGSFYLYTSDGTTNSTVTKFDPTTMTVDSTYVLTAPTVIDGAGVSICAPLKPTT